MLGLLRRRLLIVLVPVLLVGGAALGFSLLQEKRYEVSTSVLFQDSGSALASDDPDREAATNVRLLQLGALGERVEDRLGKPFHGGVDLIGEEDSNLATIIVTGTNPSMVARVANAYAREYVALRRELGGAASTSRAKQVSSADPPSSAISPNPPRNAVVGALIGLVIGIGLAVAFELRDRRVRDSRYFERVIGRPIIGKIPPSRALAKSSFETAPLPGAEAEAFRTTRANLRHLLRERSGRAVLVTSASPGEGKTTIVWNLARVEAAAGARVLVVEADMRSPALAASLGANGAGGLSEVLTGDARLESVVETISFEDGVNGNKARSTIDVLFAGKPLANPAELLDSDRMQAMLDVLSDGYDLVIIDTPPTVAVSDAMPIIHRVGGVVVVGRIGLTTDESLEELRGQLDNLDASILGVVVNADATSTDPSYYDS